MGFIYILTFPFPSMKSYVGQTTRKLSKRFWEHRQQDSNCALLKRAIDKYGWQNITIIVNEVPDDDLNNQEEFLIRSLRTLAPQGYNLTEGGSNGKDSEETRKKKSDARKDVPHTKETKQKISKSLVGHLGVRGSKHSSSKIIYQYSLDRTYIQEFESAREAARSIPNGHQGNISSCARGKLKSSCGFIWSYEKI